MQHLVHVTTITNILFTQHNTAVLSSDETGNMENFFIIVRFLIFENVMEAVNNFLNTTKVRATIPQQISN